MRGSKFTTFVMYVILLITFLGLINMIFDLHRFALVVEFLILLGLFLVAIISAIGINNSSKWAWILLKMLFIFVFLDMIFINVVLGVKTPYFLLLLVVVAVGFFISFFNIGKPKVGEAKKSKIKVEKVMAEKADVVKKTVKKTYSPGKFIASKTGVKYHAPKCDWAKKVKKKNAVWFNSKEEAKKAGYKADSCVK
jgi:glucan phosphoethanolaminetransferase (alkaline phosphatase superfamily)